MIFLKNNQLIDIGGNIYYYNDQGDSHRDDGLAVEYVDGSKIWFQHGKLHREDGPAIEYVGGDNQWWYNDKFVGNSFNGYDQLQFEAFLKFKTFI